MEDMVVPEEGNLRATDSLLMDRSDQESESLLSSPTHVLGSVISSSQSSHTQLQQHASALLSPQSKLKSHSGHKAIWNQHGFYRSASSHAGVLGFSSSDDDMEVHAEDFAIHTRDDKNVIAPMEHGEAVFLDNMRDNICNAKQHMSLCRNKPWSSPNSPPFWRITRQEPTLSNGREVSESKSGVTSKHTAPKTDSIIQAEIKISDSTESHLQNCSMSDSGLAVGTGSKLWRAESLESICSSGSSLSLAERVEINRTLLRQMLQKTQRRNGEVQHAPVTDQRVEDTHSRGALNDSDWDSGISLHDSEQSNRSFVSGAELPLSPRHEQAKQLLERARMKARSNPLKADHTILPLQRDKPELLSRVGAPVQQAPLAGTERVVVGSGNLSDSSSSDSTGGSRRRRTHGQSPTRVRFQDESEEDAEVRYLERQRRRAGERAQGLLGAKPSLATYINSQRPEDKYKNRWSHEKLPYANSQYEPEPVGQQCNSCGTILRDFSDSHTLQKQPLASNGRSEGRTVTCWVAPTLPNRLVRIEQIKETYIGSMSPVIVESDGTHCRATGSVCSGRGTPQKQKRRSRRRDDSPETRATTAIELRTPGSPSISRNTPKSNGAITVPPNPYALESLELKVQDRTCKSLADFKECMPSVATKGEVPRAQLVPRLPKPLPPHIPQKSALTLETNDQQVMPCQHHHLADVDTAQKDGEQSDLKDLPKGNPETPNTKLISKVSMLKERAGSNSHDQRIITPRQHDSQHAGVAQDQIRGEVVASPAKTAVNNGHVEGPMRAEQQGEDSPSPSLNMATETNQKERKAQQALRRFFSAMGLSAGARLGKSHSSSMEQLGPPLKSRTNSTESPGTSSTLKKAPSLQNLRLASPFSQLKKSSSVQNLQSPKKKLERSTVYTAGDRACSPALSRGVQRSLSKEDVGSPSALRSVGRVAQAFPDGTFLLELNRPPDRPFSFLISRGKCRPDSGVYVEDMGDSSTRKLYAGLLGVGDEILEVNGEKVAGLSLDSVTQLLVQSDTASIRVLRHRPSHR
ncbi:uncharacterized protein DAT39_011720 [Clarias magur]|uniref:PDZ domain-containing protein n=1 Tax=Clarias magur TaxID=1594786 RepID=A0A8J4TIH1_CLAMG|nr:uncharacterized protein DAT39_011720 [Clarias magur]